MDCATGVIWEGKSPSLFSVNPSNPDTRTVSGYLRNDR